MHFSPSLAAVFLLTGLITPTFGPGPSHEPSYYGGMRLGVEAGAVPALEALQAKPDFGTLWVGAWNLRDGWQGTDEALRALVAANVTPAIHHYYWGDDLNVTCLEEGCWSDLHGTWKDGGGWTRLTEELAAHLHSTLRGRPVLVLLETEFNKLAYGPLDGYLAYQAQALKAAYPAATITLAFGNWAPERWDEWEWAASASDAIGLQGLRALTRDTEGSYSALHESLLDGARRLHSLYGKPVVLHDIGLSSHPEPGGLALQEEALASILEWRGRLQRAGVEAILYRSWHDSPGMDLRNHFGVAERHWGLAWENGTAKPAGRLWVESQQRPPADPPQA